MKCPHCLDSYHPQFNEYDMGRDKEEAWRLVWQTCPNCKKFIIHLAQLYPNKTVKSSFLVYPKTYSRSPLSSDVPEKFAKIIQRLV